MAMDLSMMQQTASELHVAAAGGQGARALARLLVDIGNHQGATTQAVHSGTDPLKVRPAHETETATVRFAESGVRPFRVTAILEPELMNEAGDGLLLINSPQAIESETVRSLDASGIAQTYGVPAYLPMAGALAKAIGWEDLERVKMAVKLALENVAPYWVGPGLAAVEAGFCSL